jgi:hypothetical protein
MRPGRLHTRTAFSSLLPTKHASPACAKRLPAPMFLSRTPMHRLFVTSPSHYFRFEQHCYFRLLRHRIFCPRSLGLRSCEALEPPCTGNRVYHEGQTPHPPSGSLMPEFLPSFVTSCAAAPHDIYAAQLGGYHLKTESEES